MAYFKPEETQLNVSDPTQTVTKHNQVRLEFDDPKEVEGKYGKQYMYTVFHNGQSVQWYASETQMKRLVEIGAKAGTTVDVIKLRTGTGKTDVQYEINWVSGPGQQPQPGQQQAPQQQATTAAPTTTAQPAQQRVYYPVENWELIKALAADRARMAAIAIEACREHLPDGMEDAELYTFARGLLVGLDYDTLAVKRGEGPSLLAVNGSWIVQKPPEPPDPNTTEGKFALMTEKLAEAQNAEQWFAMFFGQVAEHSPTYDYTPSRGKNAGQTTVKPLISHANHAKEITALLGYTKIDRTDPEVWQGLAQEIWTYEEGRITLDMTKNEALRYVHEKFGRPLELMELDEEPDEEGEDVEPTDEEDEIVF